MVDVCEALLADVHAIVHFSIRPFENIYLHIHIISSHFQSNERTSDAKTNLPKQNKQALFTQFGPVCKPSLYITR